jgi:16S rRNA (adenine1518-N6/adenine1519-N6)-dimethyltransferase
MSREELEGLLARYNIKLDPNLDQQHLVDDRLLEEMIDLADIRNTEIVLEVGAGCGTITEPLAKRAEKVYAIEKSQKFLPVLKDKLENYRNVQIIIGDAMNIEFPRFDKIISNLPYSICEGLMQKLVHHDFRVAVFIVPLSFARKIAANPDDPTYSKFTLMISFFYDVKIGEIIEPDAHLPAPKVYTALTRLTPKIGSDLKEQVIQG